MDSASAPYEPDRLSLDDSHRMAEVGIPGQAGRVERLAGEIIPLNPFSGRECARPDRFAGLMTQRVGLGPIVRVRDSVRLGERSLPEPDLGLLRPEPEISAAIPATPGDLPTLIEVMDASAGYDRGIKLGLFAREGVAEVWLVDLNKEWIEVHRRPISGIHTEIQIRPRGESVSPEAFPELVLAVDSILG